MPLVLFARLGRFPRGPLAVFFSAARAWATAKFLPVFFGHVDAVMLCRLLDIGEGKFAILLGDAGRLVETGDGVPDVAHVGQRLLALFGKGEHAVRQVTSPGEFSVLLMWFPG